MNRIEEVNTAIRKCENRCLEAVEYVGAANYQERESEARQWVGEACTELLEQICQLFEPKPDDALNEEEAQDEQD